MYLRTDELARVLSMCMRKREGKRGKKLRTCEVEHRI